MPGVPEWSNEGTELNLRAKIGKALGLPVYLEGDFSSRTFTGQWETVTGDDTTALVAAPPQFPETPEGETGEWTLVTFSWGTPPDEEGALYRYDVEMDGTALLFGRLEMVADA